MSRFSSGSVFSLHWELQNHPQFIRSGQIVKCVAVTERPLGLTTATPLCTNYCNQSSTNHLVVTPPRGHRSPVPQGPENLIQKINSDKSCDSGVT